ncbi:Glycerol-3-phosphate acyltransferase [Gammaproteobacteria bacterium]
MTPGGWSVSNSAMNVTTFLLVIFAYLLGSVATAIVVSRLMGLPDPRTQGSGNPGATNVLRLGNKKAAALTLFGDSLKGLLPVILARSLETSPEVQALVALAAFFGHLYPVFFGFKGGKGVATALGVLLGFAPLLGLGAAATWLAVFAITRISAVAALIAALFTPFYAWWLVPTPLVATAFIMTMFLIWRHQSNIRSLLASRKDRQNQPH